MPHGFLPFYLTVIYRYIKATSNKIIIINSNLLKFLTDLKLKKTKLKFRNTSRSMFIFKKNTKNRTQRTQTQILNIRTHAQIFLHFLALSCQPNTNTNQSPTRTQTQTQEQIFSNFLKPQNPDIQIKSQLKPRFSHLSINNKTSSK